MLQLAYGQLGYSWEEFRDLSWNEFNWAVEGYYADLKLRLGIIEKPGKPSDDERERVKEQTEKWITFFKRPTLKAHG